MKKAYFKLLLFISPFIVITIFVFLVDPYNLFNISHFFPDETKIKCYNRSNATSPRGTILWKTIEFERDPTPNIIIGDSRLAGVTVPYLEEKIGGKATVIAIPAGNYKTIIDLFWMTAKSTKLKTVIIQTAFNTYTAMSNIDLYSPARQLIDNRYQYFLNLHYVKDCFSIAYYTFTKNEKLINQSYTHKDNNWDVTNKVLEYEFLTREYIYPRQYFGELSEISKYCAKEGIKLIFVIAPDYYKIHDFIKKSNLSEEYDQFKKDIRSLGITIDLDYGIPFSKNKDNYIDYFHIKTHLVDTVATMIFKSELLSDKGVKNGGN